MINFTSWLIDRKISAVNVAVDITLGEYAQLAEDILSNNELQRRKVSSAGRVYQLLARDLREGCVMPPIILATSDDLQETIRAPMDRCIESGTISPDDKRFFEKSVAAAFKKRSLLILDGLQRTFTILECLEAMETDPIALAGLKNQAIRLEIYVGLSKTGILYRMLTLNSGQTPMTFRHQLEILYHDSIDNSSLPDGISITREVDERRNRGIGKYKYSDVIDMFYAYGTGVPQSFDRESLINKLGELDFLEQYNSTSSDMLNLLEVYNAFVKRINDLCPDWSPSGNTPSGASIERPFGNSIPSLFAKVQPMTGFGAECQQLVKRGKIQRITDLYLIINNCQFRDDPEEGMRHLLQILSDIERSAKKIGDAQRAYFQYAFRHLFNEDSRSFQDLSSCWLQGHTTYASLH